MHTEFIMYKFALFTGFSYFCLLWAFVLCFVSSDECISKRVLTNLIVRIFYVKNSAVYYEHCARNFAYYKCRSQRNNGTFHIIIFPFTVCCAAQY